MASTSDADEKKRLKKEAKKAAKKAAAAAAAAVPEAGEFRLSSQPARE